MTHLMLFRCLGVFVVLTVLFASHGVNGRFCFKCIALNCQAHHNDCEDIKAFALKMVKPYYSFQGELINCPNYETLDGRNDYRAMQIDDVPCKEESANHSTCAMGRMQIRIRDIEPVSRNEERLTGVRYFHGTIVGCAKSELIRRISKAARTGKECDYILERKFFHLGSIIEIEIEHCQKLSMECWYRDYCIGAHQINIRSWEETKYDQKDTIMYVLLIAVFILFAIVIVFYGTVCWNKRSCKILSGVPESRYQKVRFATSSELASAKNLHERRKVPLPPPTTESVTSNTCPPSLPPRNALKEEVNENEMQTKPGTSSCLSSKNIKVEDLNVPFASQSSK